MAKKSMKINVSDDSDNDLKKSSEAPEKPVKKNDGIVAPENEIEPEPTEEEIQKELSEGDMLHEPEDNAEYDLVDELSEEDDVQNNESEDAQAEITEDVEPEPTDDEIEAELSDENMLDEPDAALDIEDEVDKSKTVGEVMDESEQQTDAFKPDPEVDAAVDDIVRLESDEVIAKADAKIAALNEKKKKTPLKEKLKGFFVGWWNNKPARYAGFVVLFLLFAVGVLLPTPRYAILNLFGVRVSSSMNIVDSQTRLPLEGITVNLQGQEQKTNDSGYVEFSDLKLGKSILIVTKRGYADDNRTIVLGWGSNPLGDQGLEATGEQFTFVLSDWLSEEPITQAKAVSGENNAVADETGKIVLTIGEDDIANVEVRIEADGYRAETLKSGEYDAEESEIKMVPSKKNVFVSNRDGQFDLYKIDVDGENEELLLEATGKEREVPTVLAHPTRDYVAYISSRDGEENEDGFVLDGLFIIDTNSGEVEKITRSEQLQLVGWSGDRIIYSQVVEGTSRGNAQRSRIISYNYVTTEKNELATANYFNDVELVGSKIFYAVSSFAVPQSQAKLYSVMADGTDTQEVVGSQVWTIYRKTYDTLVFNAINQKWFQLVLNGDVEEIDKQNISPRNFVDSPDGSLTAWTEIRDGKGVLLKSSTGEFSDEQVLSLPGLENVQYWPNNSTVVFRVISNTETADYIVPINKDNPEPRKITDVTATERRIY